MDLANYLVPVNADVADLDAISVEEDDLHVTSTGRSRWLGTSEELVNKSTHVEEHQFTFILSTLILSTLSI